MDFMQGSAVPVPAKSCQLDPGTAGPQTGSNGPSLPV